MAHRLIAVLIPAAVCACTPTPQPPLIFHSPKAAVTIMAGPKPGECAVTGGGVNGEARMSCKSALAYLRDKLLVPVGDDIDIGARSDEALEDVFELSVALHNGGYNKSAEPPQRIESGDRKSPAP